MKKVKVTTHHKMPAGSVRSILKDSSMNQQGLVEQGINLAAYFPTSVTPKLGDDLKPKQKFFSGVPL